MNRSGAHILPLKSRLCCCNANIPQLVLHFGEQANKLAHHQNGHQCWAFRVLTPHNVGMETTQRSRYREAAALGQLICSCCLACAEANLRKPCKRK
eukprot:scaffold284605_cov18-Prasinocladus_malaysianus.AAC.1